MSDIAANERRVQLDALERQAHEFAQNQVDLAIDPSVVPPVSADFTAQETELPPTAWCKCGLLAGHFSNCAQSSAAPELPPSDESLTAARAIYQGGIVGINQAVYAKAQHLDAQRTIAQLRQEVEEWKTAYQNECMLTTKQIAIIAATDARKE